MLDIRTPRLAVAAMFFLNGGLFGAWASRVPSVRDDFGLSTGELGLLLLGLAGGAIMAFPAAGFLSDRFGSATLTKWIALVYCPALVLIGLSHGVISLAIALVLFGAAHGAMDVAMNSWGAEVERSLGKSIMSSLHAMFSLGAGMGAASGVLAAAMDVDRTVHFLSFALLTGLPLLWLANVPWRSGTSDNEKKGPVFAVPKGGLLAVGVIAFCVALGEGAMADWSAVFLVSAASATESEAALGYTVFSIAMVVTRLVGDRVISRFGEATIARLGGMLATLGILSAVIGAAAPVAYFGFALMGVGYAVILPLAFSRAANDKNQMPGVAIAGVATFGYGGFLLGPVVIGTLAEFTTLRLSFGTLAVLSFIIILMARALRKPKSPDIDRKMAAEAKV